MQEFGEDITDYKTFAANIYQAKLLASDINQFSLESLCELLIAYAYSKENVPRKAEYIYKDIISHSTDSANINMMLFAKYFYASHKYSKGESEGALLIINDSISFIRENTPCEKLIYSLFEHLLINIVENDKLNFIDLEKEKHRLQELTPANELARITGVTELVCE